MSRRYARIHRWALTGLVCTLASGCQESFDEAVEMAESEIAVGANDNDNPITNAVVRTAGRGGCTATLVAPNIVITAAHCGYLNEPGVSNDGGWHPLDVPVTVTFGPDRSNPIFTTTARTISGPAKNDPSARYAVTDIALLRLQDMVPRDVAIPRSIIYEGPLGMDTAEIVQVGYGGGQDRRYLKGDGYRDWTSGDPTLAQAAFRYDPYVVGPGLGLHGTNIENGDSGGPMLYKTLSGPVFGVLSHWQPTGVATFAPGGQGQPSVRRWLQARLPSPKPDLLKTSHNAWCSGGRPVVNIHLENHGVATASPTYVDFFIGRPSAPSLGDYGDQWDQTPPMTPLMHSYNSFTLTPEYNGSRHWVDVIVDTDDTADESIEQNNISSFVITLPDCS